MTELASVLATAADWLAAVHPDDRQEIQDLLNLSDDESAHALPEALAIGHDREAALMGVMCSVERGFFEELAREFTSEMHDLLCSKKRKYEPQRKNLHTQMRRGGPVAIVSSISAALAPYLGQSATVIAPAVVVTVTLVGRVGLNARCATYKARRK